MSDISIILIRHGEAAASWSEDPDPGLSDNGHEQAENLLIHDCYQVFSSQSSSQRTHNYPYLSIIVRKGLFNKLIGIYSKILIEPSGLKPLPLACHTCQQSIYN